MISSLMRQGLCRVSIGLGKECFSEIDWLNKSDGAFGTIAMGLLLACAASLDLLKTRRNYGQDWIEPLE